MKANDKRLVCSIRGGEVLPIRDIVREPAAGKATYHWALIGEAARGISRSHIGNSSSGPHTKRLYFGARFTRFPSRGCFDCAMNNILLRSTWHIFYTASKNLLQPNEYTVSGATLYNRQTYMLHTNYTFWRIFNSYHIFTTQSQNCTQKISKKS